MHVKVPDSEVKDYPLKNYCNAQPRNKRPRISTQEYTLPSIANITSLWKALLRSVGAKLKEHLDIIWAHPLSFDFYFLDSVFFANPQTRGLGLFWKKKISIEKQEEVWFSITTVSMLSLTNESHVKLGLYKPWHQREENEGENCIKTCKNNLSIKPDIYEHSSKKLICGFQQFGKNTRMNRGRKTNKMKCIDILKSLFI